MPQSHISLPRPARRLPVPLAHRGSRRCGGFGRSAGGRMLLAGLLAASALALCAADGTAASVVVAVGDRSTTFTAQQLTAIADVAANDWQPGAAGERHPDAVALRRLIESAGGDPAAVRSLAVTADGGPTVELAGRQLEDPPPFGAGPPIPVLLWSDADGIHFARPVGRQLLDRLDAAPGATVTIAVTGGAKLELRVRPSASRVEAGAPITLTAVVDDPPAGRITYRWDLGDGRQGRGPQLQHAFRRPGRYAVTATATSPAAIGTSAPVEIVVGRAPREPARRDAGAGDTGGGDSGGGAGGGSVSGTNGAGDVSSSAPSGDATAPTPPSGPSTLRPRAPEPQRQRRGAAARDTPAEPAPTLSGELLASATEPPPTPPTPAAGVATARAGAQHADEALPAPVPWQAVAVAVLLAGGAFVEWRCGRRGVIP